MSKNSDIALIDSQSNESIQWSDKSLHIESTEDLKAFYSDSELANITRPKRISPTQAELDETMDPGSRIPKWRTLLKNIYGETDNLYGSRLASTSRFTSLVLSTSPSRISRTSRRRSRRHIPSEGGSSSEEIKRSEEISSELDITRRTDLDDETLEDWWVRQATAAHRRIVLFLAFLILLAICHLVFANWLFFGNEVYPNPYLCDSDPCQSVAENILSKMNESAEPCEDFHLFVCGKEWGEPLVKHKAGNDENWPLYEDQIHYDYGRSKTVGKMIRSSDKVLAPFYRACMDIKKRNAQRLKPYFELLKKFGLHSTKCSSEECKIEKIIARLHASNVLDKRLFDVRFHFDYEKYEVIHTLPQLEPHIVFKYGYDTYISVVKKALTYMSQEGKASVNYDFDWGTETEIEAYANLFLCAELNLFPYNENEKKGPALWNLHDPTEKIAKVCKYMDPTGTITVGNETKSQPTLIWSDFLQQPNNFSTSVLRAFDYVEYNVHRVGDYSPNIRDFKLSIIWRDKIIRLLDGLLTNHDLIVRYFQWAILFEHGYALDATMDKIFWPITRHFLGCDWVTTCIWSMFQHNPNRASRSYMEFVTPETEHGIRDLMNEFSAVVKNISANFTFASFVTRDNFTSNETLSFEEQQNFMLLAFSTADLVWHKRKTQANYKKVSTIASLRSRKLHLGEHHFKNVFEVRKRMSDFTEGYIAQFHSDSYWKIGISRKGIIARPNTENCLANIKTKYVMPLGSYELPYFGTYFPALDIGGIGMYAMTKLMYHTTGNGMFGVIRKKLDGSKFTCGVGRKTLEKSSVSAYNTAFRNAAKNFAKERNSQLWIVKSHDEKEDLKFNTLEKDVNDLYTHQLNRQLALKVSYEVHEEFIRRNETVAKLLLPGLEKYNARQLFFIQSMSRICEDEKYSYNKIKHMMRYGPIPAPISINLMAANSKEFSQAFGCKAGTRMNPPNKYNLYKD